MNLIRRLLSHGFLIFTLVVLAAAYYYRAQLFPGLVQKSEHANPAENGTARPGEMVVEPYSKIAPPAAKPQTGTIDQPPEFRTDAPAAADANQPTPTGTFSNTAPPAADGTATGAPQFRSLEEETAAEGSEPGWDRPLPKASGVPPEPLPPVPEVTAQQPMPPLPSAAVGQPTPPAVPGQQAPSPVPGQPMLPPGGPGSPEPPVAAAPAMPPPPQFAPPASYPSAGPPTLGARESYGRYTAPCARRPRRRRKPRIPTRRA